MRGRVIVYTNRSEGCPSWKHCPIRRMAHVRVFWNLLQTRRIRLAAYGARLERVLGSRPRGFKSPILRFSQMHPGPRGRGASVCAVETV